MTAKKKPEKTTEEVEATDGVEPTEEVEETFTAREDGSVRMANSKGWEYWMRPKDAEYLLNELPEDKRWKMIPDPAEGEEYGPTGPPKKKD